MCSFFKKLQNASKPFNSIAAVLTCTKFVGINWPYFWVGPDLIYLAEFQVFIHQLHTSTSVDCKRIKRWQEYTCLHQSLYQLIDLFQLKR
jgi:hypothetical protein